METRPVKRKGSAVVKPYEPNPILKWFYDRYFAHITVDDAWSDQVRKAARKGVVVYVMRSISFLDFLCLDFLTKRFALPSFASSTTWASGSSSPSAREVGACA